MLGRAFSQLCSQYPCAAAQTYQGCFDSVPMIGIALFLFLAPLGVFFLGAAIVEISQKVAVSG